VFRIHIAYEEQGSAFSPLFFFAVCSVYVPSRLRQPHLSRDPPHCLNAERDVLLQIDAKVGSAVDDVIAVHAAGKRFPSSLLRTNLASTSASDLFGLIARQG
jgi:hypothetical protein